VASAGYANHLHLAPVR